MTEKTYQEEEQAFLDLQIGREKGLDFFFNRYYTPLVFYSTSFTHDNNIAQDIASEAFIKLWNKKTEIENWRKVKFLLYRIVHNASIDYLRKKRVRDNYNNELSSAQKNTESTILEKLIETETNHHLYLLLSRLPIRCRQVFQMFYLQDKALKEIAEELGISVNTVKSQKQRAVQLLKEKQSSLVITIIYFLSMIQ